MHGAQTYIRTLLDLELIHHTDGVQAFEWMRFLHKDLQTSHFSSFPHFAGVCGSPADHVLTACSWSIRAKEAQSPPQNLLRSPVRNWITSTKIKRSLFDLESLFLDIQFFQRLYSPMRRSMNLPVIKQ